MDRINKTYKDITNKLEVVWIKNIQKI
jgi:hypothetical protein